MKLELLFLIVVGAVAYNVYTEGKVVKMFSKNKKYFQVAFVIFVGGCLYLAIRKSPDQCKNILLHANNAVKYMPIDKSTMDILSPIIDFTSSNSSRTFMHDLNSNQAFLTSSSTTSTMGAAAAATSMSGEGNNGVKKFKRAVSETKKKYVASLQNWRCGNCDQQLNAWFEVDHRVRLSEGGSNEVDNLVALCRECHGEKTAMENMQDS
jgi:RNase P subunit RPR2